MDDDDDNEEDKDEQSNKGEDNEEDESEEEEEEEDKEDGSSKAAVQADIEDAQEASRTDLANISFSVDSQNVHILDVSHSTGRALRAKHESDYVSEKNAKSELEDTKNCPNVALSATDVAEDCVVSAIRVESKFSDEEESLANECFLSNQKIILNQESTEDPMLPIHQSSAESKENESDGEPEKDQHQSWSDDENDDAKAWNDRDDEQQNKIWGSSHIITSQRDLVHKVGLGKTDSLFDADVFAGSNTIKGEKHRSFWGSSQEGSNNDMPKESQINSNTTEQVTLIQIQTLQPEADSLHPKDGLVPSDNQPNIWDSSLPVVLCTECVSSQLVLSEENTFAEHGVQSCPQPKIRPIVEESEWDDQNDASTAECNVASLDLKSNVASEIKTKDQQERFWEEEDKESIANESNDPSPVVSTVPEDDDGAELPQIEGWSNSENEMEDDSWDVDDESVESEQKMKRETLLSKTKFPSLSLRPTVAVDKTKADKKKAHNFGSNSDDEFSPHSINENMNETKSEYDRASLSKDTELSEDSDSKHLKLHNDFTSTTVKMLYEKEDSGNTIDKRPFVGVDADDARLLSYVPLENKTAVDTETKSSDDLSEGQTSQYKHSSPPTKDGNGTSSNEALPQTDIDDIVVNSPDDAEDSHMKRHKLKDTKNLQVNLDALL